MTELLLTEEQRDLVKDVRVEMSLTQYFDLLAANAMLMGEMPEDGETLLRVAVFAMKSLSKLDEAGEDGCPPNRIIL